MRTLRKLSRNPQVWLLSTAAGLLALVLDVPAEEARGESKKKKRTKVRHQHEHAVEEDEHDHEQAHAHHHHSKLLVVAGATVAAGLGGTGGEEEAEEGPAHGLRGAMLHDHGGDGDEPREDGTIEPTFSLGLGYRVKEPFSLIATFGLRPSVGLLDPTAGVGYESEAARNVEVEGALTASLPLSKESKESYKRTTVALAAGPHLTKGKWSFGVDGGVALTFYSKTVVHEDDADGKAASLQEDHDHEAADEHDHVEGGAHDDRELNRYTVEPSLGYELARRVRVGAGLELAMVTHQFGANTYETVASLAQATWSNGPYAVTGTLATIGEGASPTVPTAPFVAFGVLYVNE